MYYSFWVGISDNHTKGVYRGSDASAITWIKWYHSYGPSYTYDCIYAKTNYFQTRRCYSTLKFVCQSLPGNIFVFTLNKEWYFMNLKRIDWVIKYRMSEGRTSDSYSKTYVTDVISKLMCFTLSLNSILSNKLTTAIDNGNNKT